MCVIPAWAKRNGREGTSQQKSKIKPTPCLLPMQLSLGGWLLLCCKRTVEACQLQTWHQHGGDCDDDAGAEDWSSATCPQLCCLFRLQLNESGRIQDTRSGRRQGGKCPPIRCYQENISKESGVAKHCKQTRRRGQIPRTHNRSPSATKILRGGAGWEAMCKV